MGRDDAGHDDDERACRATDLDSGSPQRGDDEAGDNSAVDPVLRWHAGRDGKRHRQRKGHQPDRDAGDEIADKRLGGVAAPQALHEFGHRQRRTRALHHGELDSCSVGTHTNGTSSVMLSAC